MPRGMKNCLLGSNAQFIKLPFAAFAEAMERDDLRAADLTLAAPHFYIDSEEASDPCGALRILAEKGIDVCCVTPPPYRYSICAAEGTVQWEKTIGYYRQCILFAGMTGAGMMPVTASGAEFDREPRQLLENAVVSLKLLAEFAGEHGVELLLGTVPGMENPVSASTPVILTLPEVNAVLDEVDSPALKALLDTEVVSMAGESITQWFALLGERIRLVRFADGNYNGYRAWGEGCLPCGKFLSELKACGYNGPLSLALPGERYCEEPAAAQGRLLAHLRRAMAQVE